MGQINCDQSHQIMAILATNTDWKSIDFAGLGLQGSIIRNPEEAGVQFTAFLKNGARVIIGEPEIVIIDRSLEFDPASFIGKGWKIEEQDERSLALTEMNLTKVHFKTCLKSGEDHIKGEEKFERLKKAGHIRLNAKIFLTLWKNQQLIPESWKEKIGGSTRYIFFDGTILLSSRGDRYVLCLYWDGGRWHWYYRWLDHDFSAYDPSAVLAS